jgi:hypothetical protein
MEGGRWVFGVGGRHEENERARHEEEEEEENLSSSRGLGMRAAVLRPVKMVIVHSII